MPRPSDSGYSSATFTAEQIRNAQIIISVGRALGASARDIQIALATAMQESSLRNLSGGTGSSVGLFQQTGPWGTFSQRHDPYQAARMFFLGGHGAGQPGLLDDHWRNHQSLTEAAQWVQRSAYPDAYADDAGAAAFLLSKYGDQIKGAHFATVEQNAVESTPTLPQPTAKPKEDQANLFTPVATPGVEATDSPLPPEIFTDWEPGQFDLPPLTHADFKAAFPGGSISGAGVRQRLVREAMTWLGVPYAYGRSTRSGVDCSALVQNVFSALGFELPRVSYAQANSGRRVSVSSLQPGDLVAWDNSSRNDGADHIAIYAGNGYIIEAPRTGLNVRKRKLGTDEGSMWGVSLAGLLGG